MSRASSTTIFWMACLAVGAVALTVAGFFTFVPPWHRTQTFYAVLAFCCLAELVFFGYGTSMIMPRRAPETPSRAVRLRVLLLGAIWLVVILVSGSLAVRPSAADTFYCDKIILLQSILAVLFLAAAYLLHRQEVTVHDEQADSQQGRIELQSFTGGLDMLLDCVRRLGEKRADRAVELDRLAKRLDTLRTQLMAASPAAPRADGQRLVQGSSASHIRDRLHSLHECIHQLEAADVDRFDQQITKTNEVVQGIAQVLHHREGAVSI